MSRYHASQVNHFSYSYRDQSLSTASLESGNLLARKGQLFLLLRLGIQLCFVLSPPIGAVLLTYHFSQVYQTYQQGTCTLSDGQVVEKDSKDKNGTITNRSYYPSFSFTVHTKEGSDVESSGYDGPSTVEYDEQSDAQSVIDQYQIGQNVKCWYNPYAPDKAFIIFYGYQTGDALGTFFGSVVVLTIFAIGVYLLFDWTVWRLFALWKRGVVTQGIIVRHEPRIAGRSHYTVSIVSFQAREERMRRRELAISPVLPRQAIYPVCYDPLFPRYRRFGSWPSGLACLPGIITITLLAVIGFAIANFVWFMA